MSVTTQKKQQQQAVQNNAAVAAANAGQQAQQYQQSAVSAPTVNTTSANTKSYNIPDIQSPANYTWGTDPGSYSNRYQAAMDGIMNQIKNKKKFKYEFNGDALFKAYKDLYTQNGKQAMQDTMGNAAQLTGGYGNSYAQNVGQQTYQQYMTQLHDVGLQLRDRAYQMNQDELANLFNLYQMYQNAEAADYARYKDAYGAYQDAMAAQGSGGRGGSGSLPVYTYLNGKYYKEDENGRLVRVERPNGKFYTDRSAQETWDTKYKDAWQDEIDKRNRKNANRK